MADSAATANTIPGTAQHQFEPVSPVGKPRPGKFKDRTVSFSIDENHKSPQRSGTLESEASRASSKLEERWRRQTILSLDGGGIRGYSSLLILKKIMMAIEEIEQKEPDVSMSSFSPDDYVAPHNNNKNNNTKKHRRGSPAPEKSPDSDDDACRYLPCHYFDYIGGTSTGGLIAIMLGRLRMGIDQCLEEYENFGGQIFDHPRWFSMRGPLPAFREKYDGKRLRHAVEAVVENRSSPQQKSVGAGYFGAAKDLCKTIVVAYRWEDNSSSSRYGNQLANGMAHPDTAQAFPEDPGAYLFRSYDHWAVPDKAGSRNVFERNPGPADNIPIWQVARATTAAPTYFDPIAIQNSTFGDGGLGSNNPVQEIYTEVAAMHPGSVVDVIVSIGTGEADAVKLHTSGVKKIFSYLNATKALATDSEEQHKGLMRLIKYTGIKSYYQRFNLPKEQGLRNMKLDEWKTAGKLELTRRGIKRRKESTLDQIRRLTEEYCKDEDVEKRIHEVARRLVEHRRARCTDTRKWELWATGVRHRCTVDECDKSQKLRSSKIDLQYHIEKTHSNLFQGKTMNEKRNILEEKLREGVCHY